MPQGAWERVRMRPMLEREFEPYLDASLEEYAAFVARNHDISLDAARARAATSRPIRRIVETATPPAPCR